MQPITRCDYDGEGLDESLLPPAPWAITEHWVDDARCRQSSDGDVPEPDAISVATTDADDQSHVRTVLMRYLTPSGPGFYTNLRSRKGIDLQGNPKIAAALTWPSMFRAVRFTGTASQLPSDVVMEYFRSRPYDSRIGAWASNQSQITPDRTHLEGAVAAYERKWPDHGDPEDVPLPEHWGGYLITCDEVELWAGRSSRLHDRLVYVRQGAGDLADAAVWRVERRQP